MAEDALQLLTSIAGWEGEEGEEGEKREKAEGRGQRKKVSG